MSVREPVLAVDNLQVEFRTDDGIVRAVDGISFSVGAGETLGIVGESGSGKSVSNLAIMQLIPQPPGRIVAGKAMFAGRDLLTLNRKEIAQIRGRDIAMIFQDPMTSLNPFLTVEEQLTEVTRLHLKENYKDALDRAISMLQEVGIPSPEKRISDYPHQFSGGMRQRVMIAMALLCNPKVLIADEPTTALDVTIQAQILDLLQKLQEEHGTSIVLITHDLGVVAKVCHRVHVMYAGRFVEKADNLALFKRPNHPYTEGLLESIPRLDRAKTEQLTPIAGQPPDLTDLPPGCSFAPRCPYAENRCREQTPDLASGPADGEYACFFDIHTAERRAQRSEVVDA